MGINDTPKSNNNEKTSINLNQILPKIVKNPWEILEFLWMQETRFTFQSVTDSYVDYFNEYLNLLSKLKMEEQPRCKEKVNFNFWKYGKNKKIALFNLDETLVHCTKDRKSINGDIVNIKTPTNEIVPVGLNIRPY